MVAFKKVSFIVNPHSGGGRAGRHWAHIEKLARKRLGKFESYLTNGRGDATVLTRQELDSGCDLIVCVGGDGTFNEVINGFIEQDQLVRPEAVLAFLPNGTGCDFVRTASIPVDVARSLDVLISGRIRHIDIGKMGFANHDGLETHRYFHNISSFGLGGEVDARVNRGAKLLSPFFSFIWATLLSIFLYGKKTIHLAVDDHYHEKVIIWNVAIANGQYHGGGMRVAPAASLDDGLFHVVVIGDLSLPQVFWHLPKLYNGRINDIAQVKTMTGKKISAFSQEAVLLDVDGEQPGRLPATFEILPRLLPVLMA